jgi:hypothetical protein
MPLDAPVITANLFRCAMLTSPNEPLKKRFLISKIGMPQFARQDANNGVLLRNREQVYSGS